MPDMSVVLQLTAQDDASASIAKVRDALSGVGQAAEDTGKKADETRSAFDRIKDGMEQGFGLALGYAGFRDLRDIMDSTIETVVGFNAQLEGMSARLEILTGSVGGAADALQSVKDVASQSPFELKDIEAGEERLLRFNFSLEDTNKILKVATDAAAAGFGTVDSLTQSFGRLNEKTDLSTRGLMGLMQAGVPVFDILAKGLNVTTKEAEDLVTKGLIPTKQGMDILLDGMEQRAPQAAAKMGDTFDGLVVRLKDSVGLAVAQMGKPLFDVLESAIRDALAFIDSADVKGALDDFSKNVASTVHDVIDWFQQLGSAMSQPEVQENLHAAWENIKQIGSELWGLVRDFFIPQQSELNKALGVTGVDSANSFAGQLKQLSGELRGLTDSVKEVIGFLDTIDKTLNTVKDAGDNVATMLHNQLIEGLQEVLAPLRNVLDMLNELSMIADKTFHIKIDIPGQAGLQQFLDSIHTVQTVSSNGGGGGSPGDTAAFGGSAAALRPSQFNDPALSADEAARACGPAAAVAFAKANGMYPTLRQAQDIAERIGWTVGGGMNGIANEQTLLTNMGMGSTLNTSPTESQIQTAAHSPAGEIISTPGHFFTATGYNSQSGEYNVGTSGSDLTGGAAQMTLAQMQSLEGTVNGILTDIHKVTSSAAGGAVSAAKNDGMDAFKTSFQPYADYAAAALHIDPSDVTAMAISESGGGNVPGNSFFGMKASAEDIKAGRFTHQATWELENGQRVDQGGDFKTYDTPQAAVDDWIAYIKKNDPQAVGAGTPEEFATGLKAGGYMSNTAANYAQSLRGLGAVAGTNANGGAGNAPYGPPSPGTGSTPPVDPTVLAATVAEPLTDTFAKLIRDSGTKLTGIQTTEDRSLTSAATQYGPGGTADQAAEADAAKKSAALASNKAIQEDAAQRKAAVAQEVQDDTDANNAKLAAEATVYNRQLQDQATVHSRQIEDAQIIENQQLQAQATVHQRTLQDAEILYQDGVAKQATLHAQQLQDAQIAANEQLAQQATVHSRQLQDADIVSQQGLDATAVAHSRQLQDTEAQYQLQRAISKNPGNATALEAAAADAADQLAHQRQLEDAEAVYQRGLAATALAQKRADQDTEAAYQQGLADTALAKSRADAETESQYQMGLKDVELAHQRSLQDTETAYQQQLAAQALVRSRAAQDAETAYNRGLEDKAAAHTAELQAAARAFAAQEKAKVDAVDKQLADEAYARQQQQVVDDLAAKKKSIADEYATRTAAAVQTAADARAALKASVDQSAQDQIDAATKALAGFNGAGDPVLQKMKDDWAAFDGSLATATSDVAGNQAKVQTAQAATAASATAATTAMTVAYAQSAVDISKSLGIADVAVETFANSTGATWDQARLDLNNMVTQYGVGSQQVSAAFGITDKAVETFAIDHHESWDKARIDLNAAALNATAVLGKGGTIPTAADLTTTAFDNVQQAAAKTSALDQLKAAAQELAKDGLDPATQAAKDLNTAIQEIQDKTIHVHTVFDGQQSGSGQTSSSNPVDVGSMPGAGPSGGQSTPLPGAGSKGTVGTPGNPSGTPTHPGESGPGGIYNDPHTGQPYDTGGWLPTGLSLAFNGTGSPERVLGPGESNNIDYDKLAEAMVKAMNKNGAFAVGVDQVHSALLQKARRSPLGLS